MTTWTRDQVHRVASLRAELFVERAQIARDARAEDYIKDRLVKELVGMAEDIGVVVDPGDLEFRSEDIQGHPWVKSVKCRWRPDTLRVELRGAHHQDGLIVDFHGAPHLALITQAPPSEIFVSKEELLKPVRVTEEIWKMVGWSEAERCWVYGLSESRSTLAPKE